MRFRPRGIRQEELPIRLRNSLRLLGTIMRIRAWLVPDMSRRRAQHFHNGALLTGLTLIRLRILGVRELVRIL